MSVAKGVCSRRLFEGYYQKMVSTAARIYLLSLLLLAILDYTSVAQDLPNPYRAAKTGGNYMINYYLPPAPSTTSFVAMTETS